MKTVLYLPPTNDPQKVLDAELGSHPPTARNYPKVSTLHERCLDCDNWDHQSDTAMPHCWDCDTEWPCKFAGQEVVQSPEHWALCSGTSNDKKHKPIGPEALILVWYDKVAASGCDRLARVFNRTAKPDYTLEKPGMELYTFYDVDAAVNMANRFTNRFGGLVIELDLEPESR